MMTPVHTVTWCYGKYLHQQQVQLLAIDGAPSCEWALSNPAYAYVPGARLQTRTHDGENLEA